jgi:LacI family transcriptional regulator
VRERLVAERLPTVFTNICLDADCVYPDDEGAARQATEYLLSLGHTRVGYANFLDDSLFRHYSRIARRAGYEAAMRSAGLAPQLLAASCLPDSVHARPGGWLALAAAVLDKPATERPTAIFTYGVHEALSLMYAAAARGIDVPGDLSIMGVYDNFVDYPGVRVSTMIIPAVALGEAAVRMLDRKIASGGEAQPPHPVPFRLDPGDTCAPPRSP